MAEGALAAEAELAAGVLGSRLVHAEVDGRQQRSVEQKLPLVGRKRVERRLQEFRQSKVPPDSD